MFDPTLYRDPRWQQLRLRVFERDNFTCRMCESTTKPLSAHHLYYLDDRAPWDYPIQAFLTLCEECHACESEELKVEIHTFVLVLRQCGFMARNFNEITCELVGHVNHDESDGLCTAIATAAKTYVR